MSTLNKFLQAPQTAIRVIRHARRMREKVINPWQVSWKMLKSTPTTCTAILRSGKRVTFRNINGDISAVQEVLVESTYGPLLAQLPFPVKRVIDIGAHIGCFTLTVAQQAELVIAVEPESTNFTLLEVNVADNDLKAKVRPINAAAGAHNGSAKLYRDAHQSVLNSLDSKGPHKNDIEALDVKIIALENLVNELGGQSCDLLKVDCEGAEFDMFYQTPSHVFDRIKSTILEIHASDREDYTPAAMAKFLRGCGFKVECIPDNMEQNPNKQVPYGHGLGLLIAVRAA